MIAVLVSLSFYSNFILSINAIGKTCLLTRFNDGKFLTGNFRSTVGVDCINKIVTLGNIHVNLQIFDTVSLTSFSISNQSRNDYYPTLFAMITL